MLRLFGLLVAVLAAIATAIVTWPQFFHVERMFPIAQIVAVRGVVAVAFLCIAILALLLSLNRKIRGFAASIAIIAIIGGGANAAILATRGIGSDALPSQTADSIRVMTWNTAGDATDADSIAKTAVMMDADIVSLPETANSVGEDVAVKMRELGKPMWVHHVTFGDAGDYGPDAWQTTILISPELGDYSVIDSSKDGSSNTSTVPSAVAMPVDGTGPIVVAVHAVAPRPQDMEGWVSDLQWIADQCASESVILAGDFNATLDHMAGLGTTGQLGECTDAAAATGNGAVGTWPTSIPALVGTPIDHVMVSKHWKPTGSVVLRTLDSAGSDHRPLVVQLEPTG